ncbi:prepilin-type N-terminal cleavage/methylation domain-containing protein [Alcaligenaceae bacterium]|nr:prepilin-type N-terminal cleavage/methylation domain-containing protein [Alcaligenaceae bacterium]
MSVAITRAQQGFSLIEVSIVTAIVLLLAIIGVPAIGSYVIENKVPKVGEELARFILQTKINVSHGSSQPYADIDISNFANLVRDSSIFSVSGTGPTIKVLHGLGTGGDVDVAANAARNAFSITLHKVNNAACPSIASVMQRVSDSITITSLNGATAVVKDTEQNIQYNALTTETKCAKGDVNTFVFTAS